MIGSVNKITAPMWSSLWTKSAIKYVITIDKLKEWVNNNILMNLILA
jgi:hypothetical protein